MTTTRTTKTVIHLLLFFAIVQISFGGCKNKAAKNSVNIPEEFFNDSLPEELKNFATIEFVSQDVPPERVTMFLKSPQKINLEYPPLLEFSTDKSEWLIFDRMNNIKKNDLNIIFNDSLGNERAVLQMKENIPTGFLLKDNGKDKFYSVANYATFEVYEGEYDEYFDSVLEELEQKSSRVDKIPQAISNLIPSNYKLYFCAIGDLNRDNYNDAIIIVEGKQRECWMLTGLSDNSFKINIIKKIDDIGDIFWGSAYFSDARSFEDPLFDIVIKNGHFSVERYGGVSGNNKSIDVAHFKYSKEDNNWLLFRSDFIPSRFLAGNCCYDFHLTTYFEEKILFEDYSSE